MYDKKNTPPRGQILLITDGSPSIAEAGKVAINLSRTMNLPVRALFILDKGWRKLLGDEWISNACTRTVFFRWLEKDLHSHAQKVLAEFKRQAEAAGILVEVEIKTGQPEKVIIESTVSQKTALLVLPSPHASPPAACYALRFNLNTIAKKVPCPIFIGPGTKNS